MTEDKLKRIYYGPQVYWRGNAAIKKLAAAAKVSEHGAVTKTLKDHEAKIRRAEAKYHRGQAIVERFNKTLAERLFGYQYWKELEGPSKSNREWVQRLPVVIASLNNEATRVTGDEA